ncbi:MAG: hypothetical protein AVDCRST_MAG85-3410 [uncultured Solirubrobacteraceae bacterium]|uniref:Uncharacterized protein n=1 Tax=uncultured Solirubrobacteraceae bacterium TaxID=1162706 RepID=A0A6J4TN75_9ACTN|nr:MAG: hypothetical protein AVDCRST_MAG85-3410 [uncultured Solirubrobacteraceae bacterium]
MAAGTVAASTSSLCRPTAIVAVASVNCSESASAIVSAPSTVCAVPSSTNCASAPLVVVTTAGSSDDPTGICTVC